MKYFYPQFPMEKSELLGEILLELVSFILVFLSSHPSPVTSATTQVPSFLPLLSGSPPPFLPVIRTIQGLKDHACRKETAFSEIHTRAVDWVWSRTTALCLYIFFLQGGGGGLYQSLCFSSILSVLGFYLVAMTDKIFLEILLP